MNSARSIVALCAATLLPTLTNAADVIWPDLVEDCTFLSSADDTHQPTLIYVPATDRPTALLVALHPWGANYRSGTDGPAYAKECIKRGWAMVHPNFRGPNRRPEAVGSELVVGDILSAVEFAKSRANVDPNRIYLAGVSGGGFASLLMAGRSPKSWTAVSAWVPIADLRAWHHESKHQTKRGYWRDIEAACGGPPGSSDEVDEQYRARSPLSWLENARHLPVDINAGVHDGHRGSVPVSHSLHAFNCLAKKDDRISEKAIELITNTERIPRELRYTSSDTVYGPKKVLLRRTSGQSRVTVFEGGHEIIVQAAFAWFDQQSKKSDSS